MPSKTSKFGGLRRPRLPALRIDGGSLTSSPQKRLSNEFDEHDRRRAGDLGVAGGGRGAAAGVSETDGFSGGRLAACLGSAFGADVFGTAASGAARGSVRLASITFGFAGGGRRRAGGGVGRPPMPTLRARLEKKPSFCAVGAALATRVGAGAGAAGTATSLGSSGAPSSRLSDGARGGLTWEGMVPGARDSASSDRLWPSPPSDRPVLPSGTRGGEHLVHAAVDAGVDPRHRRALRDQLGGLGAVLPAASRARRRRFRRGST